VTELGLVPVRTPDGRDMPTDPRVCRCGRPKSPGALQCRSCFISSIRAQRRRQYKTSAEGKAAPDPERRRRLAANRRRAQGDYAAIEQWARSGFTSYGRVWG
jgi:hypothetical protein